MGSRRRLDSARLAFSAASRLARKPSWPGVASSRAFPGTPCVNGRLRAKAHDLFRRGLVRNAAAALPQFLPAHSASFMYLS